MVVALVGLEGFPVVGDVGHSPQAVQVEEGMEFLVPVVPGGQNSQGSGRVVYPIS